MRRTRGPVLACLAIGCAVLLPLLTACGGTGSSGAIGVPSISASLSPTRERPTPTRSPSRSPSAPDTTAPGPSSGPTSEPTSAPPTKTKPTKTKTPTTPPTTPTTAPTTPPTSSPTTPASSPTVGPSSASASPKPKNQEEQATDDTSSTAWWWLLAAVVVVGALIAFLLVRRARRRAAWAAELSSAEDEVAWFARDLIPQLRGSGTPAGVSGGWAVAAPRVGSLDDRLTQLATTAPGEEERARATALQQAVRTARDRVAAVVAAGDASAQWSLDLDQAQAPLLAVLVPAPTAGGGDPATS